MKIQKKASKFLLEEAEESGEDEEDESNEEEDGYDLQDSFVDQEEYTQNGLCVIFNEFTIK